MQASVADAGYLEGGSVAMLHVKRARKLRPRSLSIKIMPIFEHFGDVLPVNWYLLLIEIFAKVSQRSRFLSSSGREGGSI